MTWVSQGVEEGSQEIPTAAESHVNYSAANEQDVRGTVYRVINTGSNPKPLDEKPVVW
ncbi:hypothetical protein BaRGS_00037903, partial [Batillaria attramentaria]